MSPLLAVAAALASPLHIDAQDVPLLNANLLGDEGRNLGFGNAVPGDGRPDGWASTFERGAVTVRPEVGPSGQVARITIAAGTQGTLCSAPMPVTQGRTLLLKSAMRGGADLGDVTALHLRILGDKGEVYTARRRFDTGDHGWEPVEVRATAPPGAKEATICLDVRMLTPSTVGSLSLAPLKLVSLAAESRTEKLPLEHIILVTVETFRWDHLHRSGYSRETTPNLDKLAAEGAWFGRNQAQAPYTHPSLASILSSRYPQSLGFGDNFPPDMLSTVRTAPEILADAGYVTAAFNVQYTLSNRYGLNRGFHYYRNYPNDGTAAALNREAFGWLAAHEQDNSFLWLHYFDPHGPYRPTGKFANLYTDDALWTKDRMKLSPATNGASEGVPYIPNYVNDPGQVERRHYVAGYDGDIASVDAEIGRVVDLVRAKGWERSTLLIVTGDHGESMTDHDRYFCHGSLYQHDLHVPLIVWAPGRIAAGKDLETHTGNLDILPTILDYAGVRADTGLQGESLRPLIEGRRQTLVRPFTVSMVGKLDHKYYAAIDDSRFKILLDGNYRLTTAFNLEKDKDEMTNLVPPVVGEMKDMSVRFKAWLQELAKANPPPSTGTQTLDAEDIARLKELGYIE